MALAMSAVTRGQDSHVLTRYEKGIDRTVVHSDLLYVVNTPSQFIQIQMVGRYPKQGKPTEPPDRIYVEFFSFAAKPLYQMDVAHRLQVKADDQILDFGLLSYSNVADKIAEKNKEKSKQIKSNLAVQAQLPATALISANRKSTGLTLELMSIQELSLADLTRMARANVVLMKIGDTIFRLTPIHMTILREFVAAISPANIDVASLSKPGQPAIPSDVPSDANKMPLDETLKWIKRHLEREGTTKNIIESQRLEPLSFNSCRVSYRLVPLFRTSSVSSRLVNAIMQYEMDLADLNPEAVSISDLDDYVSVFLNTRDYQEKIRVTKHANESGTTGRTLEDGMSESSIINLKNLEAASRLKLALVHAINLCHGQR
jgi:hypothetical protein